jgi:hypothetical protein
LSGDSKSKVFCFPQGGRRLFFRKEGLPSNGELFDLKPAA